jgi:hypothetical protein
MYDTFFSCMLQTMETVAPAKLLNYVMSPLPPPIEFSSQTDLFTSTNML